MTKLEARLEAPPAAAIAPVRDFKDLDAWKLARNLRVLIFVLLNLAAEERFARNSQPRPAVQSIAANIAEGFGRYWYQENGSFAGRGEVPRMRWGPACKRTRRQFHFQRRG
jgi:hypothetical protein